MKRATLLATIAVCFVNVRHGVAETKAPNSGDLRAIALEVLIVGVQGGTEDGRAAELSGPSGQVAARVRDLESEGRIAVVDRIRLTTLENQKTLVQVGRTAPVASGRSSGGRGGPAQVSYRQQSIGTLMSATARVDGDAIVVELQVEKSQLERRASKPEPDDKFVPLATETLTSQVTVRIGSGKTVLASGLEERADAESSGQLVLASARLVEPSSDAKATSTAEGAEERHQSQSTLADILATAQWATVSDRSPDETRAHKGDETDVSPEEFDAHRRNRVQLMT